MGSGRESAWDRDTKDRDRRRRSRSRSRDRRRSRSRDRRRSKSRSRSRDRHGGNATAAAVVDNSAAMNAVANMQAMAALQQQQQMQRQLMLQQQMLLQQQAMAAAAQLTAAKATMTAGAATSTATTADRKSREIYVGNLAIGVVTPDMLKELFNTVLASQFPDQCVGGTPVVEVKMDAGGSGRFGFVEFRTRDLCDAAIQLDKLELCGRPMNIGRPKGFADAPKMVMAMPTLGGMSMPGLAQGLGAFSGLAGMGMGMAGMGTLHAGHMPMPPPVAPPPPPQVVCMLDNLVNCASIRNEQERKEITEEVLGEAGKCGVVCGCAVPIPPASIPGSDGCRIFIKFAAPAEALKCKAMMDGRTFDESLVKAVVCTEHDFLRAQSGEWFSPNPNPVASVAAGLPGPPPMPGGMMHMQQHMPNMAATGLTLPPGFTMAAIPPAAPPPGPPPA